MPDELMPPEPARREPELPPDAADRFVSLPDLDPAPDSEDVEAQSEQSFPASDPPSWSGVSI